MLLREWCQKFRTLIIMNVPFDLQKGKKEMIFESTIFLYNLSDIEGQITQI